MKGTVLSFDDKTNKGLISGHDGNRYKFSRIDWESTDNEPREYMEVDFDTDGKKALEIICVKSSRRIGKKSRPTAIAWALLAGGVGAHKFYLRQHALGFLYLLFFWTGIPLIIALIEVIFLACLNQEEFDKRYND